jgi:hypothetical protein
MHESEPIGASDVTTTDFRELKTEELIGHTFSDYFRFSFTFRMDRDEALQLARRIESLVSEVSQRDCRLYMGVRNR